jgi:arylsulfatase A-like enzyme
MNCRRALPRLVLAGTLVLAAVSGGLAGQPTAQPTGQPVSAERPNVLWITSEDNAAHWLGCYGNVVASTPRLQELAGQSMRFENAFANAPVCAVARSTILTGCYAVTTGTQHMRSRYRIPERFRPSVSYLREAGYYCSNRSKTDYNIAGDDRRIWDACSGEAHYRNRAEGQPFFAVFNLTVSHESSLFPERVRRNRQQGRIPPRTRLQPADVVPPPCLPDLPEVRADIAIYHDTLTALDQQIGRLLKDLEKAGLADNTIVFYYSDHGGPTPRGKRYLYDTGVRVPLLVRVPPRWRGKTPFAAGESVQEPVSFVDFAPTLLSLCGIQPPPHMQGRAFLGDHRVEPAADAGVFLYADRFDGITGMRRGFRDGRYKYIRRFTPHLPAAPYSQYSLQVPSWRAWQEAWQAGQLDERFATIWQSPQPVEMLFDVQEDAWEVRNLANLPEFAGHLQRLRSRLLETMIATGDSGVVPESLFREVSGATTLNEAIQADPDRHQRWVRFAWRATQVRPGDRPALAPAMSDADPVIRYWALQGCQIAGAAAGLSVEKVRAALQDPLAAVRIAAAEALIAMDDPPAGQDALVAEFESSGNPSDGVLYQLSNAVRRAGVTDRVPPAWAESILQDDSAPRYIRVFAEQILGRR